jgi:type IV pilus assembly protein PilW
MNRRQHGMTLIELMVALAIGAFLMIGAITVFVQSRMTFRVTESVSRLQENARFALDSLEPDIRMAHYWGLTSRTYMVQGRLSPEDAASIGNQECAVNWAINLDEAVEGTNNDYTWDCDAQGTAQANSDTLVVRRASEDPVTGALTAGGLYIQSSRAQLSQLFEGTIVPGGFSAATSATHRLLASLYYVDETSSVAGMPSLRRKWLENDGDLADEELVVGVEDMQIEFGIDSDVPGTAVTPNPNRGSIDRYVNPDDPLIDPTHADFDANAEVLAVRIWLRLRGERVENGLTDATEYEYADQDFGAFDDGLRRVLVSKTIYLRNARPPL